MAPPPAKPAGPRRDYLCVQALRAVAAALVVVHHSISLWLEQVMHTPNAPHWTNGASGVDIFFVISGFVMTISLPGLAGKPNKAGVFLGRRFTRIVPLYWAALTVQLTQIKLNRAVALDNILTPWRVAASYLFIPARNGKGEMFPLVTVGWTLNYEVFFYLLFACALAFNISPLAFLTPVLTAVALLGLVRTQAWPDCTSLLSPVVIEFLFGVVLAHMALRRRLPRTATATVLLTGGFIALMLMPEVPSPWGYLAWGLAATAVVTGAVGLEDAIGHRVPCWLLAAGDASYALYLTHNFLLPHVGNLLRVTRITGRPALAASILLSLAVSFPFAILIHRIIERPLMSLFKKRREITDPRIALAASGLEPVLVEEA
jgi:exopolysaccharide production protein ExoZ